MISKVNIDEALHRLCVCVFFEDLSLSDVAISNIILNNIIKSLLRTVVYNKK